MKTLSARNLVLALSLCFMICAFSFAQTASDYIIKGRVFNESNQGVDKVRVCAKPDDYNQVRMVPCTRSDSDGNFELRVGRPAHYTIFPEKTAAGYQWQVVEFYRNPSITPVDVDLTESNRTATVSVPLGPKNGSLVGKVIDADTRRPIDNVRFIMCQAANTRICWATSVKDEAGEFDVATALVPFTLKIGADGYEDWWGLSGQDKNVAISVASGARTKILCLLKRRPETANQPMSEAEKFPGVDLPAPVQSSPADRAELKNANPRRVKLEWQPVESAASCKVEIDFCDGRDRSIRQCVDPKPHFMGKDPPSAIFDTSYEFDFVGMQPGRWRVWAIDKKGQAGFKSPWRLFFFVP